MKSGKVLIMIMIVIGLGGGALGVWYRHYQMNQVMEALSPRVAELLNNAPVVELVELEPIDAPADAAATDDQMIIQGRPYRAVVKKSLSESPAFKKLRKALVQNIAYDWTAPQPADPVTWPYLLILRRDSEEARLAFDPTECLMALPDGSQVLSITHVAPGLAALMKEPF